MVDITTLANLAEIFGFVAVVIGFAFAIYQIREGRNTRQHSAAMALLTSYVQEPENMAAIRRVSALRTDWFEATGGSIPAGLQVDLDRVQGLIEVPGLMVYRRAVSLADVEETQGDMVRGVWPKLRPYAEHLRATAGRDGPFEWAEWLHDRLARNSSGRPGAFEAYRDWRP